MINSLQLLCIAGLFSSLNGLFSAVIVGTGAYIAYTVRLIIMTSILLIGSLASVKYGIEAVAVAVVLFSAMLFYLSVDFISKRNNLSWKDVATCILPAFVGSSVMLSILKVSSFLIFREVNTTSLLSLIIIGIISYVAIMMIIPNSILTDLRTSIYNDFSKFWIKSKSFFRG